MQQGTEATLEPGEPPQREPGRAERSAAVPGSARGRPGPRWPEWGALLLYAGLVAVAIPYHEPWVDEAQAWQLARSLPLPTLFKTFIRYEGSPGLWHFLLWILIRLQVSYAGLHWICGAVAIAATGVLLFRSPFPRSLRLWLPFTYFLLFQYAVVARNYVLVPLLLYLVAIAWKRSPFRLALALGLLANASLHAAVISGGLAAIYAVEEIRTRRSGVYAEGRKLLSCAVLLVAFYAFAIWTAWPPHDLILSSVRGQPSLYPVRAVFSLLWPTCQPWIVSIPFWIVAVLWFQARRKLLYLLPVALFAIFSGEVSVTWWHAGLLIPLLICLLWITWDGAGGVSRELKVAGRAALAVLIGTQVLWSGYALYYDHFHAYSPDPAAAKFLSPYVQEHASIAVTYVSGAADQRVRAYPAVGILPYFDHNIFANTPYAFWWWSDEDPSEERFEALLPSHPQIVLVEETHASPVASIDLNKPRYVSLAREGYRFVTSFCGTQPRQLEPGETLCHVVFEYGGPSGMR
jgi:hypothetical protein